MLSELQTRLANGGMLTGSVTEGYRLDLPILPAGKYGLAQVDDYRDLPRRAFPHRPPLRLALEAWVSGDALPGTWGFGLWNDPFSIGFGGGMARILPVLPNAAWFFYGSDKNHLALRDDQPGAGFHAKTFRSPRLPSLLSLLAIPALPWLIWPAAVRLLRKVMRRMVKEDARALPVQVDAWHTYALQWTADEVVFSVDEAVVLATEISPLGSLGLVIWMDNQYFRVCPSGEIGFGLQPIHADQWLQIKGLSISAG